MKTKQLYTTFEWLYLMMDAKRLEDKLSENDFEDRTIVLAVASYLGGQAIKRNLKKASETQDIKKDGSTVGILDMTSGQTISSYVNSAQLNSVQFNSEEKMPFKKIDNPTHFGIFDDLDGSINSMIGGTNLHYIGVGGVIHQPQEDEQISVAAYIPIGEPNTIFLAEKGKGTYSFSIEDLTIRKIELPTKPAQKNILIESGFMTPHTLEGEHALYKSGFYDVLGITAKDRVTAGIFQTVSGIKYSRQVVLNIAPSHLADFCYLLLSEAGAEVIGQNGNPMYSTSYAMLSIAPSFTADRSELKDRFVKALKDYQGWSPRKVTLNKVCE